MDKIDWFDLLAVHGTLKSLFQHHSSKASIKWRKSPLAAKGSDLSLLRFEECITDPVPRLSKKT